ncbi:hypothetical protein ACFVVM_09350 [Nocardia sp. NPDC058176]|uniref:hypothetical protein n=1 Tax=Nocardia sp. NPDC058176 TaxID=3346368 RepID=UPI0036D82FE6
MSDATTVLLTELGGEPADVIRRLTPEEAVTVLTLYLSTKQKRRRDLDTAIDDILGVLPRLVRIPARKIMFGK